MNTAFCCSSNKIPKTHGPHTSKEATNLGKTWSFSLWLQSKYSAQAIARQRCSNKWRKSTPCQTKYSSASVVGKHLFFQRLKGYVTMPWPYPNPNPNPNISHSLIVGHHTPHPRRRRRWSKRVSHLLIGGFVPWHEHNDTVDRNIYAQRHRTHSYSWRSLVVRALGEKGLPALPSCTSTNS